MDFEKGYSFKNMINVNEAITREILGKIMELPEDSEICSCSICLEDIYTITLNSLPIHYKHSLTVDMHRDRIQNEEIKIKVVKAIKRVRKKLEHP